MNLSKAFPAIISAALMATPITVFAQEGYYGANGHGGEVFVTTTADPVNENAFGAVRLCYHGKDGRQIKGFMACSYYRVSAEEYAKVAQPYKGPEVPPPAPPQKPEQLAYEGNDGSGTLWVDKDHHPDDKRYFNTHFMRRDTGFVAWVDPDRCRGGDYVYSRFNFSSYSYNSQALPLNGCDMYLVATTPKATVSPLQMAALGLVILGAIEVATHHH